MEYRTTILDAVSNRQRRDVEWVGELAQLPQMIREYETIKLDNVELYRTPLGELLAETRAATRASTAAAGTA